VVRPGRRRGAIGSARFHALDFKAKQSTCELAFAYLFRLPDGAPKLGDARRLLLYDSLTGEVIGRYGVNGLTLH
jgi:hypothetical protein